MRKPRDFDAELKTLTDKAKQLKARKVQQLGELVIATRADAFDVDVLTGALLAAVENKDIAKQEAWRTRGVAYFRGSSRKTAHGTQPDNKGDKATAGDGASH
eukprot:TRINITY_DN89_c0_g2_i1.p2 TRINITY_DN89_c0_g2~~TRINITY_DN89_c0_g2_i1.p2  ORF type:complete len:102 (-),score=5.64 TRINITY_DN89_c0_g2_i1:1390-1695(-)